MLNPARLLACLILIAPPAWSALPFAVAPVKYQMADTGYTTEATVEAVRQSTVAAQVSGRVGAVNFDAGDYVKAGTVIVRLSAQELGAAVAGSQAQVAQAAATLANARANYERQQQLFQQKFISQAALDRAAAWDRTSTSSTWVGGTSIVKTACAPSNAATRLPHQLRPRIRPRRRGLPPGPDRATPRALSLRAASRRREWRLPPGRWLP